MRIIAHIVLLVCVSLYSLGAPVLWGLYYLEADRIAAAYCVNPDKPSCHGKCHMAKLTVQNKSQDDAPPLVERNIEKPILYVIAADKAVPFAGHPIAPYRSSSSPFLHTGYPQDVYHPPA